MAGTVLPGILALVGVLSGVVATWVTAHRRTQGRIDRSEASDVWKGMADLFAASESIRHDLTARVELLERRLIVVEASNALFVETNALFVETNAKLQAEISVLRKRLEGLHA